MEIDARFRIMIDYTLKNGTSHSLEILPTEFFEYEQYGQEEWACDLPWRLSCIKEYLPATVGSLRAITLSITDSVMGKERVIDTRILDGTEITLSWNDRKSSPSQFEVIVDTNCEDNTAKVARLDVSNGVVELTSFSLIDGDSLRSLMT